MKRLAPLILSLSLSGCAVVNYVAKPFVNLPFVPAEELTKEQADIAQTLLWSYTFGDTNSMNERLAYLDETVEGEIFAMIPVRANLYRKRGAYELAEREISRGLELIPDTPDSAWNNSGIVLPNGLVAFMIHDTAGLIQKDRLESLSLTDHPEKHYKMGEGYFSRAVEICPENMGRAKSKASEHLEELLEVYSKAF